MSNMHRFSSNVIASDLKLNAPVTNVAYLFILACALTIFVTTSNETFIFNAASDLIIPNLLIFYMSIAQQAHLN